jgi:hypothetical protein
MKKHRARPMHMLFARVRCDFIVRRCIALKLRHFPVDANRTDATAVIARGAR